MSSVIFQFCNSNIGFNVKSVKTIIKEIPTIVRQPPKEDVYLLPFLKNKVVLYAPSEIVVKHFDSYWQ